MNLKTHFKKNLELAVPVMLTQAGQVLVNIADNVMVGGIGSTNDTIVDPELGKLALGAVALGNAVFFVILNTGLGFTFAMSPLIAEADAQQQVKNGADIFSHGFILNTIIGALLVILTLLGTPLLYLLGQPPVVVELAIPYLQITTISILPLMIFQSYRQLSEGLSLTVMIMVATLAANLLNIGLNYLWIYGNWGFPRLEVVGAAYGTLVSRILMMFGLIAIMYKNSKSSIYLQQVDFKKYQKAIFVKLTKLGTPTALQLFFEILAFSSAAFISGLAGETELAAHQIALNLAATSFMLCTGLAIAATIRVGNQKGLNSPIGVKRAGWSSILMAGIFMGLSGIIFILFKEELPALYIDNPEVIQVAANLLIIAALFQLSDGIQVVTLGALRGLQDVFIPSIITFLAYFAVAIPIGYYLAVYEEMGSFGVWIGLGIGLTISAVMLVLRFRSQTK